MPHFFDYTDNIFKELPVRDTKYMQQWTMNVLKETGKEWWIAGYLEDRSLRLRGTHLIDDWRIYHLGVDIIVPAETRVFSPLNGEIIERSVELWKAGYWGYLIVKHSIWGEIFYILYGHLSPESLSSTWTIRGGQEIGKIWSPEVNGDWTTHLHMQVLTEIWLKEWKSKGYCSVDDLPIIRNYCPDPSFLIRY